MTANAELCKEVADWAEKAQNTRGTAVAFDMTDWIHNDDLYESADEIPVEQLKEGSCGTAACIAGYVALMRAPKGTTTTGSTLYLPDGGMTDCDRFAQGELGIDSSQASALFYCSNDTAIARLRYLSENPDATEWDLLNVVG